MDAQRLVGIATAALLVLAVVGLVAVLWLAPADPELAAEPEPKAAPAPRPSGTVPEVAPAQGPMARRKLPTPAGVRHTPPAPGAATAHLSTEEWRDYNEAMHRVASDARDACVRPYAQERDLGKIEIVLDAVLWDGEVVDFGLRGLQDVPDHVLDCVAEIAWQTPFPIHPAPGELRLQRVIDVDGRRPTTNGDKP